MPWPRVGILAVDVVLTLLKAAVVLVLVAVIDVVNPRLRIDQAMGYYMRVALLVALGPRLRRDRHVGGETCSQPSCARR